MTLAIRARNSPRDASGREYKPEDYLQAFARFVRDNPAQVEAIRILLDRPKDWGTDALNELRAKLAAAPERLREIGDRAEAIAAGVAMLQPGDVLVVAGKGHESGQIIGDRTLPFSDHEVVREAIAALAGGRRG